MQNYAEILSTINQKELSELVIALIIIFLIIAFGWFYNILYYKKKKKKNPKKFKSKKYVRERCRVFVCCIALTVICASFGVLRLTEYLHTSIQIKKDIENESYVIFNGNYSIRDAHPLLHGFERWMVIEMYDGKYAYVRMDNVFDWLLLDEKDHKGKIVYGENSLVVVDVR